MRFELGRIALAIPTSMPRDNAKHYPWYPTAERRPHFSKDRTSVRTRYEPADFFSGGVVQPNTAQVARDFAAAVAFPDLPSGFNGVAFVRLICLVPDVRFPGGCVFLIALVRVGAGAGRGG